MIARMPATMPRGPVVDTSTPPPTIRTRQRRIISSPLMVRAAVSAEVPIGLARRTASPGGRGPDARELTIVQCLLRPPQYQYDITLITALLRRGHGRRPATVVVAGAFKRASVCPRAGRQLRSVWHLSGLRRTWRAESLPCGSAELTPPLRHSCRERVWPSKH